VTIYTEGGDKRRLVRLFDDLSIRQETRPAATSPAAPAREELNRDLCP